MSKILDAQDLLDEVHDFIECIGMAAAAKHVAREFGGPIVAVAYAASKKIDEASELLAECHCTDEAASPVPAPPNAEPKSPAPRMKRKGK